MRVALSLIALLPATAASPPPLELPAETAVPGTPSSSVRPVEGRVPCRDTIEQVREERDLPSLRRETATPDEPLLIAAVDHRIGGCSVLVMHNNTSDVRPLPALPKGPPRMQRIPGG